MTIREKMMRAFGALSCLPAQKASVSPPKHVSHGQWMDHLPANFNKPGLKVLEVGSRNVTGTNLRDRFDKADYVGFDYLAGENVDVVGDAHQLSSYFDAQFDLIFSSAVFEHLYAPWIVAEEICKLLKLGGHVFVETHFSFVAHERPWNFFQFSDMGLRALFNEGMGFTLVEMGMSNPLVGYFTSEADEYLRYMIVSELYCHSQILARKDREIDTFDWRSNPDSIVDGTRYPAPR